VSDGYRKADLLVVEELDHVLRNQTVLELVEFLDRRLVCPSVPELVRNEYSVALIDEESGLLVPVMTRRREAMNEEDGALSVLRRRKKVRVVNSAGSLVCLIKRCVHDVEPTSVDKRSRIYLDEVNSWRPSRSSRVQIGVD
jgi:hypothetical protein